MNNEKIEELKRLAQAATPGPWVHRHDPGNPPGVQHGVKLPGEFGQWIGDCLDNADRCTAGGIAGERNAAFIAAANPAAVLELIALAERAAPAATAPAAAPSELHALAEQHAGEWSESGDDRTYTFTDTEIEAFAAALAASQAQAEPDGYVLAPHYRGYAQLGIGAYIIGHSAAGEAPELYIKIATNAEKAGRTVGDLKSTETDSATVQPEDIAVRIRFDSAAGLDALEVQLAELRKEHFAAPLPAASSQERDAKDAEILRWLISEPVAGYRWRLHKGKEQWQILYDGEPIGKWGGFREVIRAAMSAAPAEQAKGGA